MVLLGKLFKVQILDHKKYVERAQKQYKTKEILPARRGEILDFQSEKLAFNERAYDVYIELNEWKKKPKTSSGKLLSETLNISSKNLNKKLSQKKHTVLLKRNLSEDLWFKLEKNSIPGVYSKQVFTRAYPKIAKSIVGETDVDNYGISGIEKEFNKFLSGKDGFEYKQKNARGKTFSRLDYNKQAAENGGSVQLTIESYHQAILEEELLKGLKKYKPKSISGIILETKTGKIKGLASFSSNKNKKTINDNKAFVDVFDPGSTFKIITAAAALEENIIKPTSKIYCEKGRYKVADHIFRDDNHQYGNLSFREIIEKSSNIGTMKVAEKLGKSELYRYIRDFGFGQKTNFGLSGEAKGILQNPTKWSKISLNELSIGHEISVTAIQLAQAYSVIANDGILIRPYILEAKYDEKNREIWKYDAKPVRKVLSKATADTVKSFLHSTVRRGTGMKAYQKYITIAGKTGTAQIFDRKKKEYSRTKVSASFAGFFPYENPQYVSVIVLHEPRYKYNYGGQTAAPIFKNIAFKLIGTLDEKSAGDLIVHQENRVFIKNFERQSKNDVIRYLSENNIPYKILGKGEFVVSQSIKKGFYKREKVELIKINCSDKLNRKMPNLVGLSIREAISMMRHYKLDIEIEGSGTVRSQSIKKGKSLENASVLVLKCRQSGKK
jgi:cell division protein FtsI/penicillin-binding protein 2